MSSPKQGTDCRVGETGGTRASHAAKGSSTAFGGDAERASGGSDRAAGAKPKDGEVAETRVGGLIFTALGSAAEAEEMLAGAVVASTPTTLASC